MAYEHGFVHGDTHPGNIILHENGRIGLIDFGLHAKVPKDLREKMLDMLFYSASGRFDDAVEAFIQVFSPDPAADLDTFRREMKKILEAGYSSSTLRDNRVTDQLLKGMRLGSKYQLKAQSDLFRVIRNLTIVEGIALRFAPELDPTEEIKTSVGGILRRKVFGRSMRQELEQLLPQVILTLSKRPKLASSLLRIERSLSDSKNLGDFLRREQVIVDQRPTKRPGWELALLLAMGLAIGLLLRPML
jgi:predicted unusual protein kinase regulating ubiquinone biosynthesis (AarF/ABC1/UbiB family)